jgi:hypothetical protein
MSQEPNGIDVRRHLSDYYNGKDVRRELSDN